MFVSETPTILKLHATESIVIYVLWSIAITVKKQQQYSIHENMYCAEILRYAMYESWEAKRS